MGRLLHNRLFNRALFLFEYLHWTRIGCNPVGFFTRNRSRSRRTLPWALGLTHLGWRPACLIATALWVRAVAALGLPVAATASTATAASFFACAFRWSIPGLALLHCGERLIRAGWALLRLLLTIARSRFAGFLIAVASLVTPTVGVLAWSPARFIALVTFGSSLRAAVPVVAAPRIALPLRLARARLHRFGRGLWLG